MRQSPKAWIWRSIPAFSTGSLTEASALAKKLDSKTDILVIKGRSRNLLPRA